MKITVVGTGYVGLSNAILFAQNNEVKALEIIEEKVNLINQRKSPIVDREIEEYLATKELNLTATTDKTEAYKDLNLLSLLLQQTMMRRKTSLILLLWNQLLKMS